MQTRITLLPEDITRRRVDAIVNAANSALPGGGGVDDAVHCAAGAQLADARRELGGRPPGEARPGLHLPANRVIRAMGPARRDANHAEDELSSRKFRHLQRRVPAWMKCDARASAKAPWSPFAMHSRERRVQAGQAAKARNCALAGGLT